MIVIYVRRKKKKEVEIPVGMGMVDIVNIMGNSRNIETEKGIARISINSTLKYILGVAPALVLMKKNFRVEPEEESLFAGETLNYSVNIKNYFPHPIKGNLELRVPSGWKVTPEERYLELKRDEERDVIFELILPSYLSPATYQPEFVYRLEDDLGRVSDKVSLKVKPSLQIMVSPSRWTREKGLCFDMILKDNLEENVSGVTDISSNNPTVRFTPSHIDYSLSPGQIETAHFVLSGGIDKIVPADTIHIVAIPKEGARIEREIKLDTQPASRMRKRVVIDGSLQEWEKNTLINLNHKDQLLLYKGANWTGEKDLSGKVYTMWDNEYFYIGAEITDDIFSQPFQPYQSFLGDSIQLAIGTENNKSPGYDNDDYAFQFCWTKEGSNAHIPVAPGRPPGEAGEVKILVKRVEKEKEISDECI